MAHAKRWLFLLHRWLGVLLCAFFALWFVSGVVMMYMGYPKLTPAERLAHLPALRADAVRLEPAAALAASGLADAPLAHLSLAAASGGRAVYLVQPQAATGGHAAPRHGRKAPMVIDAATGAVLAGVDMAHALASAAAWAGPGVAVAHKGTLGEDAFTHSRALDMHRPLHRVDLGDVAGTRLYISGTTGEVVRDAPRAERAWNYAGAWLHWLYPLRGGVLDAYWADTVNTLSVLGIAAALAGTVVGVWRWRFRGRYKNGQRSPYTGRMMHWHHVAGLAFAGITLTWIFSGLMSMNPWRLFDSGAAPLRTEALQGGPLRAPDWAPVQALLQAAGPEVRELRWSRAAGHDLALAQGPQGTPQVLDAATAAPRALEGAELRAAIARLLPAPLLRVDTLTAYDFYYYARDAHTMTGGGDKPLPVLRAVFGDAQGSWVHVDPRTGAVLGRLDGHRRANRWLFALLHSWDWPPLLALRPGWDLLLIALSLGGAALSLTGVVIGVRRLARKLRGWRRQALRQS